MAFWVMAGLFVASKVAEYLLRPKEKHDAPKPAGLSDLTVPRAEEGAAIPIVWGNCLVKSPNTLWYGNLTTQSTDTGFKYSLGVQLGICVGPIDRVSWVLWEDRHAIPTSGSLPAEGPDPVLLGFNSPNLFGGSGSGGEGGVSGNMRIYLGTADQPVNAYLEAQLATTLPAYRRLAYAVLEHMYLGTSP